MTTVAERTYNPAANTELSADAITKREEEAETRLVARAVRRAQAGDRDALGFLYGRYADNVYGYVRSIVLDHHEAEDVTQHVFAKLAHSIGKYQEREVPFFAWILRVARNAAVDHVRQRRTIPVEEVRATDLGTDGAAHGNERANDLRDALATLPHAQREVLVLRHFAGLTPVEIARRTGKSEGSIHGLHHRGRRALWAELITRDAAPAVAGSRGRRASDELPGLAGSGGRRAGDHPPVHGRPGGRRAGDSLPPLAHSGRRGGDALHA